MNSLRCCSWLYSLAVAIFRLAFKLSSHVRQLYLCCVFYYFDADMRPAVVLMRILTWSAYSVYQLCSLIPFTLVQLRERRDINICSRETPREIPSYLRDSSRDQKQHLREFGKLNSHILEGTYVDTHNTVDYKYTHMQRQFYCIINIIQAFLMEGQRKVMGGHVPPLSYAPEQRPRRT